jgi:MinD superfamily P-loop ATPase
MRRNDMDVKTNKGQAVRQAQTKRPTINANRCRGCTQCATLCRKLGPNVLNVVGGRAAVARPIKCISDGACLLACSTRPVRIPRARSGPFGAHAA